MNSREQIEQDILHNLPQLVQLPELDLPTMVRNNPSLLADNSEGRQKVPRNMDRYSFVSLTEVEGVPRELMLGEDNYDMPHDVRPHYFGGRPLMDGPAGLGIVVEKDGERHLCAVGAVQVKESGAVQIVQLQGVATDNEIGPQLGGFRWSEALIEGWRTIAGYVGATALEVTSSASHTNLWELSAEKGNEAAKRKVASARKHYDDAPTRAGLVLQPGEGVHRTSVESQPMPVLGADNIAGGPNSIGAVRRLISHTADQIELDRQGPRAKLAYGRYLINNAAVSLGSESFQEYTTFDSEVVEPYVTAIEAIDLAMDAVHELAERMRRFEQGL